MDYPSKLALLEHLNGLVERYSARESVPSTERKQLYQEICETYGQVADVYESLAGKKKIKFKILAGRPRPFQTTSRPGSYQVEHFTPIKEKANCLP